MAFSLQFSFITGMMLGLEFESDEEGGKYLILDLAIIRFVIGLHSVE